MNVAKNPFNFRILQFLILGLLILLSMGNLRAAESTAEQYQMEEQAFPELTEVVPKATAVSARSTEANAIIDQTDVLQETFTGFKELEEQLVTVEDQFTDWNSVSKWPLNRLMAAEARYNEINQQLEQLFSQLSEHLSQLGDLRKEWSEEKEFWQNWKNSLLGDGVEIPEELFTKTQQSIDTLLQKISQVTSTLVKKQDEYSSTQEIVTSRLVLIDKILNQLRKDTFRRNTYSLFNKDYYAQFTPELFNNYRANINSALQLPDGFWQRHGWIIFLQTTGILLLGCLLMQRKKQSKPISEDWDFLFKHPVAGAIFISLATTGILYTNPPPSWEWLVLAIATISGTILVGAMAENHRRRRLIWALAFVYLFSETLKISGLPTPAYQFYEVILCAVALPVCLLLARRRQKQAPDHFGIYLASMYLISLFALVGLLTALLGFSTLSAHLVDAVLATIVTAFLVRIAIHLADGGITEFLRLNWVRNRQLIIRLGIGTADRMKKIARVVILTNAALYLMVIWGLYNDVDEAVTSLLSIEYTIGEFSISVFMVVMLVLVLYLTNLLSWFLLGVVDAHYMTPKKIEYGVKMAMKKLLHYAMISIGFFIAISMAGLDLQKFAIIAGALGVGIGFGLQNIVNNFVSGLILLFERPVKVGDTINIDDQWGTITKIGLRSTVFETLDRSEIIVPNSDLISQKVTNWTFTTNISRVVLNVGVAYGSPLDKVLEILLKVAKEHPDIIDEPQASAIFTGFGDSSIDFELRTWISDISKRLRIKSELGQAVDRYFREEGITIPFPQRDLHLRSIESNLHGILKPTTSTVKE